MPQTDESFLNYCEIHCRTERALFCGTDARRIYALAGYDVVFSDEDFYSIYEVEMTPLIERARERLRNPPPPKPDEWEGFPLGEPE